MPPDPVTPAAAPSVRRWAVGTLSYDRKGLARLFAWLLWGDFAWQLKERAVIPLAQIFLRHLGASDLFVGFMIGSVPSALGLVVSPVVGVKSDRHRSRLGRRIPFLLIPTPIIVLSMVGLGTTLPLAKWVDGALGSASPGFTFCALGIFAVFWTAFELATVVSNTVVGALINDVVPSSLLGRFFSLFRIVSLLVGVLFNQYLLVKADEHFGLLFIGTGFFFGLGFTMMCLKVREGQYPPTEPRPAAGGAGVFLQRLRAMVRYARECFGHRYYVWVFVGYTCCYVASAPVNSFSVFYARAVGLSLQEYGTYLAISYTGSILLAYPLGILADRLHPLRLGIATILLYTLICAYGFFTPLTAKQFGWAFVGHTVVTGAFLTGTASLGQRLYPRMRFAQFASAQLLVQAVALTVIPPSLGAILDLTDHAYRLTFGAGAVLGLIGATSLLIVFRRFKQLGGDKHYLPPEIATHEPSASSAG